MKALDLNNLLDVLAGKDVAELKELRKEFNYQIQLNMEGVKEAENLEIRNFIDNLPLTNGYRPEALDVVSLNRCGLDGDTRVLLNQISEKITRAFKDLHDLKKHVAIQAKKRGIPNSEVFCTTYRRVQKAKEGGFYHT